MAETLNAPAARAMADRSMEIHSPQGTRSVRLVTPSPLMKTTSAAPTPTAMKAGQEEPSTGRSARAGQAERMVTNEGGGATNERHKALSSRAGSAGR
jgi:hypothetical protein